MSAISLSSFSFRAGNSASFSPVQQGQTQRGGFAQQAQRGGFAQPQQGLQTQRGANVQQAQRGTTFNSTFNSAAAARGGATNNANAGSSFCPTCNLAGGRQTPVGSAAFGATGGQGGQICVTCGYQGR